MNRKHLAMAISCASLLCTLPDASAQAISTFTDPAASGTVMLEPQAVVPAAGTGGLDVGISSRDGITYSVPDVLVTRNGITQKLTRQLRLTNGTLVFPDGTVILAGGARVMIKPEQVLTFGGTFDEAPIAEAVVGSDSMTAELVRRANAGASRSRPAAGRWYALPEK